VEIVNKILASRGFGNQRINMYWCSSAESEKFVKSVEDAYEKVKREGPNPINLESSESGKRKIEKITTPNE
jgi:coenzyme F420-reducing hydrogenase delta subunit